MKLVIVHYHLRPGGIRRIIELATPHLVRQAPRPITRVVLATGQRADRQWHDQFSQQLPGVPVEVFVVLFVVFLTGFAPMWLKSSRLSGELNRARMALRLESIQLTLASAALDARRGEYEPARQGTASFFNLVTAELDRGTGSALPAGASTDLQQLLAQRDDLITLLARSDPAAAERLASAYVGFRESLGK